MNPYYISLSLSIYIFIEIFKKAQNITGGIQIFQTMSLHFADKQIRHMDSKQGIFGAKIGAEAPYYKILDFQQFIRSIIDIHDLVLVQTIRSNTTSKNFVQMLQEGWASQANCAHWAS